MAATSVFTYPVVVNGVNYAETGTVLTTFANVAASNLAAYTDVYGQIQNLTLGASANVVCEAKNLMNIYTSNGLSMYTTTMSGSNRSDDLILNIARSVDTTTTTFSSGLNGGPAHNLSFAFSNYSAFNTFSINTQNGGYDVLSTTKSSLLVDSPMNFNANVALLGNTISYGTFFASNVNVFRPTGLSGGTAASNVGFGFRVNASNQLELIKMVQYGDATSNATRVAVFGVNDLKYGQTGDSAYQVFNALNGGVNSYSNGSLISSFNKVTNYLYLNTPSNAVGVFNASPAYPLDVNGVIKTNSNVLFNGLQPLTNGTASIGSATNALSNVYIATGGGLYMGNSVSGVVLSALPDGSSLSITDWEGKAQSITGTLATSGGTLTGALGMSGCNINNVGTLTSLNSYLSNCWSSNLYVQNEILVPGSDYAEYMQKNNPSDVFVEGQLVGINGSGLVTASFSQSIRFAIVSTKPSYLGGYTDEVAANPLNYVKVAYCGRVPLKSTQVNGNAPVGSYILAAPSMSGDDSISSTSALPTQMSVSQMLLSVGQVINYAEGVPVVFV